VVEIAAAKRLGLSFVELVNSKDYAYLVTAAQVDAEFEKYQHEQQQRKSEQQRRRR
tara:strand:+ start:879 stop:1046 length:168 start_codon:yes stop_codon:yes gene_type:complete